jgi:regulatory protein
MTQWQPPRRRGQRGRPEGESTPPADPQQQARDICLRLLAVRPRTRAELASALRRRGIPDADAAAVLERYSEVGMIDDAAFARAWVTSRHQGRGLARGVLARELRQRGVDGAAIGSALTELDRDTEATTARALVERRLRSMSGVTPEVAFRRLVGMLARKGYPAGLAVRTVRDVLAAAPEGAEFADGVDVEALAESVGEEPAE